METVLKSLEAIILEGNKKFFTSNHLPLSSGFSQVILEIMELVGTLMESYLKARLAIRLGFSLLLRLLKIMGQFKITVPSANDCDIGLLVKNFMFPSRIIASRLFDTVSTNTLKHLYI